MTAKRITDIGIEPKSASWQNPGATPSAGVDGVKVSGAGGAQNSGAPVGAKHEFTGSSGVLAQQTTEAEALETQGVGMAQGNYGTGTGVGTTTPMHLEAKNMSTGYVYKINRLAQEKAVIETRMAGAGGEKNKWQEIQTTAGKNPKSAAGN